MKRSRTIFVARLLLRAIVLSVLGLCGGLGAPDQARAQVFVCDSADAGESGEFASAGGGGSNFACGTNAIASGASSANTSIGLGFNISAGNDSRNLAVGFGVIAGGNGSSNTGVGTETRASGDNSANVAIGGDLPSSGNFTGADAHGDGTRNVAIGSDSRATGFNSTAIGGIASATHANSAAFGHGATTTRADQQVFGTATNTYTAPGITSAASTSAQGPVTGVVTTDADGNLASDGGALQGQVDANSAAIGTNTAAMTANAGNIATNSNNIATNTAAIASNATGISANTAAISTNSMDIATLQGESAALRSAVADNSEGIAMALALAGGLSLPGDARFAISGNWGTFEGQNAFAFGAVARVSENMFVNGGLGIGVERGTVGGRLGLTIAW